MDFLASDVIISLTFKCPARKILQRFKPSKLDALRARKHHGDTYHGLEAGWRGWRISREARGDGFQMRFCFCCSLEMKLWNMTWKSSRSPHIFASAICAWRTQLAPPSSSTLHEGPKQHCPQPHAWHSEPTGRSNLGVKGQCYPTRQATQASRSAGWQQGDLGQAIKEGMMTLTRILAPLWWQWRQCLGVQTPLRPWDRGLLTISFLWEEVRTSSSLATSSMKSRDMPGC